MTNKATILVIEDNELNMILVHDLLTLEGFTVVKAYDAETGIRMAREKKPDIILMDIQAFQTLDKNADVSSSIA